MDLPYRLNGAGDTRTWRNSDERMFEAGRNFRGDFYFRSDPFVFGTYSEPGNYLFAALLGHLKHVDAYPSESALFKGQKEPVPASTQIPPLEFVFHDVVHQHPQVNRALREESPIRAKSSLSSLALTGHGRYLALEQQDAMMLARSIVCLSPDTLPLVFMYRYGAEANVREKVPDKELSSRLRREQKF